MESQRRDLFAADVVDKKWSKWFSVDGYGSRGTVRPEMSRQPQQGSMDRGHGHAGTPKFHEDQHEQTIRRTLQFCGLLVSLAFISYIFIPWGSPYLSWLGSDSPIILYARETLRPLPLIHASDHAVLDDQIPMPNVSCKYMGGLSGLKAKSIPVVPFTFVPLPLGSIKPLGWLADQLGLMANGLAGRQYEFYHIVHNSPWLGGFAEYSVLNEGLPYWFNGLVPLAYGLNDTRLILQVEDVSDYVLNRQQSDGWIGPETNVADRDLWARFPFFLGLIQLVEAEPSRAAKIVPAMHRFVQLMHSMLIEKVGFDQIWGRVRFQDMLISLQWLYENYPEANQEVLLETMYLLKARGLDWSSYWTEGSFIYKDLDTVKHPITDRSPLFPFTHGVNAAQGLKTGATLYRFTRNESLLDNNRNGVNWTFTYHGDPAGSIIGDERESGINANRGSELCTAVETMYSMSYLYQALGDNFFGDRCELAAFNALPVSITSDHWAHQYLALASEPYSGPLEQPTPFWNVGDHGIVYGLGKNNFNQS